MKAEFKKSNELISRRLNGVVKRAGIPCCCKIHGISELRLVPDSWNADGRIRATRCQAFDALFWATTGIREHALVSSGPLLAAAWRTGPTSRSPSVLVYFFAVRAQVGIAILAAAPAKSSALLPAPSRRSIKAEVRLSSAVPLSSDTQDVVIFKLLPQSDNNDPICNACFSFVQSFTLPFINPRPICLLSRLTGAINRSAQPGNSNNRSDESVNRTGQRLITTATALRWRRPDLLDVIASHKATT